MIETRKSELQRPSLVGRLVLLGLVMLIAGVGLSLVAYERSGGVGARAAVLAVLITGVPACVALAVTARFAGTMNALSGVLGGILIRTVVPLGFVAVVSTSSPGLAKAGLFGMTVVSYLLLLAVETWLAVGILNAASQQGGH